MSVGRLEEIEAPDPGHEPWLAHTDRLPFPVEWTAQFDILSGGEARGPSSASCWWCATCSGTSPRARPRRARPGPPGAPRPRVEDQMSRGADVAAARVHGWFRLAVAGTEEECLEKVRKVTAYRGHGVTIEHPGASSACSASSSRASRSRRRRTGAGCRCCTSPPASRPRRAGRRPAWPLRRLHGRGVSPRGHVRHPLRHRGQGDLRTGPGGRRTRRGQERAAGPDHVRGGAAGIPSVVLDPSGPWPGSPSCPSSASTPSTST